MELIGISGKKLSGKDAIAEFIAELYAPKLVQRIAFGDALKEELAKAFGISVDYMNQHKNNFRLIFQGYGTDYRRKLCSEKYWIEKWLAKMAKVLPNVSCVVVPDVRMKNEAEVIKEVGGRLIRVVRETGLMDVHPSENELTDVNYPYDHIIYNDSTLLELKQKVGDMLFMTAGYK